MEADPSVGRELAGAIASEVSGVYRRQWAVTLDGIIDLFALIPAGFGLVFAAVFPLLVLAIAIFGVIGPANDSNGGAWFLGIVIWIPASIVLGVLSARWWFRHVTRRVVGAVRAAESGIDRRIGGIEPAARGPVIVEAQPSLGELDAHLAPTPDAATDDPAP